MKTVSFGNTLRGQQGSALIIVLGLMMLMWLIGVMAVDNAENETNMTFNQINADQASYIAEAGARTALAELDNDPSWRTGFAAVAFGGGQYWVTVTDNTIDSTLGDTVVIRAVGDAQGAKANVEAWTVTGGIPIFKYAMFAKDNINMDRGTCTDSYNSDSGTYAATMLIDDGDIGSNGSITMGRDGVIGGSVSTATPGSINYNGPNITVTGDTTSTADSVVLDAVPATEYTWAEGASVASSGISGSGYTYDAGTKSLNLGSWANVELGNGVYYFSEITAGQSAAVSIAPGASVTIYVAGDIVLGQNSSFNLGGQPQDLIVFSDGSQLQFDQGNTFVGGFYGPNAHIQYDQTTQVYGSLVANTIQMDRDACFHYDRNLSSYTHGGGGGLTVVAWRVN